MTTLLQIVLWFASFIMLAGTIGAKELEDRKICAAVCSVCTICATALHIAPLFLG